MSCPRRSCTCGGPGDLSYPYLPPSVPPLCRRAIGTNATQRNAAQRDPTTPSDPSPAQPALSQSEARKARAATRSTSSLAPVLLESRQVGASLEIQRSSSRQTQDRSRPGRQSTSSQYAVPARQTTSVSATHPGLASSEPALPACLPACPPTPSSLYYYPHPNKVHLLILCHPALPCPDPASHFCTLHAAPRRATCLPTSVELRGTHSLTVPPSTGSHHAVCPCPAHSCPRWTLPRVPVSPLSPTFRPSSLHTACIIRPGLP